VAGPYNRHRLWGHLIAVGVTARGIAEHHKVDNPDEVFLAGLLHDLGIIIMDQFHHDPFEAMMAKFPEKGMLYEVEREMLGFDHMTVGARVAEKWGLPDLVYNTIRLHHGSYLGPQAPAIACVELANVMVSVQGLGSIGRPLGQISPSVQEQLKLTPKHLEAHSESMKQELEQNRMLIELVKK